MSHSSGRQGGGGHGRGPQGGGSRGLVQQAQSPPTFSGLGNDQYTRGLPIFQPDGETSTPDPEVTEEEDENIRLSKGNYTKPPTQDPDLALRPQYGEKRFNMRTNYFKVTVPTTSELCKYNVEINPVSDSGARALPNGRKRRQFYKILFDEQPDFRARGQGIATDYANTLITCGRLYDDKSSSTCEYRQVYRSQFELPGSQITTTQSNGPRYNVTVKYVGIIPSSELTRYISSQPNDPSDFNTRLDVIQAMNIVMAGSPNKDPTIYQAGQNKFFRYPRNPRNLTFQHMYSDYSLTDGLIAVRGYYSSVRTSTSRVLLNLNAQCSAFYPEINLIELMYLFAGKPIPSTKYQDLEDFIQRLRVRTTQITREGTTVIREKTIRGFSHKHRIVHDANGKQILNPDGTPKATGTMGATDYGNSDNITIKSDIIPPPGLMSVSEYFRNKYGRLNFPKELVVNCGTDESPRWIPPERCTVMPGQPYRGALSDRQTSNMLTVAARGPSENARRITGDGLSVIGIHPRSGTLNAFGITVSTKMLSVHARILPAPLVKYHEQSLTPKLAEWNLHGKKFISHVSMSTNKWSYLSLSGQEITNEHWHDFETALSSCGMGDCVPDPWRGFEARLHGPSDDDENDSAIHTAIQNAKDNSVRMLWVILPSKSAGIYARIKYWADVKIGIHTVCVLHEKLGKGPMYYANVTHKFNLKLGGINHKVSETDLGILHGGDTMVVGIDVTHPAPKSMEGAPSTVGMVASIDKHFGQWPGALQIQKGKQEILKLRKENEEKGRSNRPEGEEVMVEKIAEMLEGRINVYYQENNKTLPKNILIYRDGVSEGQYQAVLDLELKPIKEHCEKLYKTVKNQAPPKITIVVVAKRHHTRFCPTDANFADKSHFASGKDKPNNYLGNPLNGTVVDRGITLQKGWDFYLQSHVALKGTAKPTHYIVLRDAIGLGGGELEKITHNLCYHYGIATKAVSICPPAYYADILCERGRCYLMKHLNMRGRPAGTRFDVRQSPWRTGVHADLQGSMFYI